jgi:putative tricarboxylic transport membrane protein
MKAIRKILTVAVVLLLVSAAVVWAAGGEEADDASKYPDRPIQLVVPANPGGGTDAGARLLAKYMTPIIGTEVVVTNMPGAGGTVAQDFVIDSEADGYTLLYFHEAFVANRVFGLSDTTFKDDFVTIGGPYVVDTVCLYSKNYTSWDEVVAAARDGEVILGTEVGTSFHIVFEAIKDRSGLENLRFVDTGAVTPTLAAMEGDQIDIALVPMGIIRDSVEAGHLNVLALISAEERSTFAPDVPTMTELGIEVYMPKFYFAAMPLGTSQERAAIFRDAMRQALSDPDLIAEAEELFFAAMFLEPEAIYRMEDVNFDLMNSYAEDIRG